MKILVDTHTHTNCSTHAHSTLLENIQYAKKQGLEMLCMTDHTPALPDAPHLWHFNTMLRLPREAEGIRLLFGAEANIINTDGSIDLPEDFQRRLDLIVASIHEPCYPPRSVQEHTQTYLGAMENPYVTILGHSGTVKYPYEVEKVVRRAKERDVCIEINNHSFRARKGSRENCKKIAEMCKKIGTKIVVSSDAHSCFEIGKFDEAIAMLEEIAFPEELIMNLTAERFLAHLKQKKG